MGETAEGTPASDRVRVPLSSHTAARPRETLFVRKPDQEPQPAGTSRASPQGPLNATDQPQRLPGVSSRHLGDAPRPAGSAHYGTASPSSARDPSRLVPSRSRHAARGGRRSPARRSTSRPESTATTFAWRAISARVASPVPAPTSSTLTPSSGPSASSTSSGYEGRAASYSSATASKEATPAMMTDRSIHQPALWGAGTPGAAASFWDTVPTPTWTAGNSSQPVPNTDSALLPAAP